jgi:hypothetical protein
VARGSSTISVVAVFLGALGYLLKGDGSAPSMPSLSPPPTALVQAAMPIPSPSSAATPELSAAPGPSTTPDRVSAFAGIASLKNEPRAVWSKKMGRPAESHAPDKHGAGTDTWKVGDLKMIVKWDKSGLLADDIDIDAIAGASELALAEAEQIVIYFGLSNSLVTYPNEKAPWYIWHDADGTPVASYGPESARLVDGKLVPENKNPGLDVVIGHRKPALRTIPGAAIPGMPGPTPMPRQHTQ